MIDVAINGFWACWPKCIRHGEPYMSGLNCGIDCASLLSMTLALTRSMPTYCRFDSTHGRLDAAVVVI